MRRTSFIAVVTHVTNWTVKLNECELEPIDEKSITVLPTLDVKPYDPWSDTIEIEGTKYSGHIFRTLGCGFPDMIGDVIRVDKKEDGCVTVTTIYRNEEDGQLEEISL